MKNLFRFLCIIMIINTAVSCKKEFDDQPASLNSNEVTSNLSTSKVNGFGVLINAAHAYADDDYTDSLFLLDNASKIKLCKQYGVRYYRMSIVHDGQWDNATKRTAFLVAYRKFIDSGFSVLLNVNYSSPGTQLMNFPDSVKYRNFLRDVLNKLDTPPALVAVENEEGNATYFNLSNEANYSNYFKELNGAVEECHSRGIKVTNGGIIAPSLIPLTWSWLKKMYPGDAATANGFARKALPPSKATALIRGNYNPLISIGNDIIKIYAASKIDYVNIHWYEPISLLQWNEAADGVPSAIDINSIVTGVLDSVVAYLNHQFNVPVITNETGQITPSAALTTSIVNRYLQFQSAKTGFPLVCWYDGDGPDKYKAYALHNAYATYSQTTESENLIYTSSIRTPGTAFKKALK